MALLGRPNVVKLRAKKDVPGLVKALSYRKDGDVRKAAAEALGRVGDATAVEPLIVCLKDKDIGVREAAAEALGLLRDARAIEPLLAALEDNRGYGGVPGASRALERMQRLPSFTDEHRAALAIYSGQFEDVVRFGQASVKPLLTAFQNTIYSVTRQKVVTALGLLGDVSAFETLIVAFKDKDIGVRQAAATALGKLGDRRAVEPLIAALHDKDEEVRVVAVEVLGKLGDSRAVGPLLLTQHGAKVVIQTWESVRNGTNRNMITVLGNESVARKLLEIVPRALDQIGYHVIEPYFQALQHEFWDIREAAVERLPLFGDSTVVEPLIERLQDKEWPVREAAAKALGQLGDARAIEPLRAATNDRNEDVKDAAKMAFAKLSHQ